MARYDVWDPLEGMDRMRKRMRRMFRAPFELERGPGGEVVREPLIDLLDKGGHYELIAELPGVEKKDIDINVLPDSIAIGAEQKTAVEEEREKEGFFFQERTYQKFYRQVPFAEEVLPNSTSAELKNGILTVGIKKKSPTKPQAKGTRVEVK